MSKNQKIYAAVVLVLLAVGLGILTTFLLKSSAVPPPVIEPTPEQTAPIETVATSSAKVIGTSVEGRGIEVYTFGSGDKEVLFVGGVHGGYEWNSVLLAYYFIDYFTENPTLIPSNLTISIIPNLNPDAVFAVAGVEGRFEAADIVASPDQLAAARFNSNNVDLNRNFDCKWQPESTWRGQTVSAGTSAFSEPEAATLRDYVMVSQPNAVVFWHSQANTVYASECESGILPETLVLMETYATAASYNTQAAFDAYAITGDAEGWLASIGIPAITVELETRTATDWERNLRGVTALLNYYTTDIAR